MAVPAKTTVLVVGGGPAGSYCAAALAREGIDTVLLEADKFPRYHIGESMLPSIRHFFRFIDLEETFDAHGFRIKNGAAFKLNQSMPDAYTDFIAAGGPKGYTWNVVRSEADHLIFKHANKSGAQTFDGIKVTSLDFLPSGLSPSIDPEVEIPDPGRPVSASWSRKEDGTSGTITFDYLVDASGRAGLMSTKYLKNRKYNEGGQLKNVAVWGYWEGGGEYAVGTHKEGSPYFEALQDASGWIWYIPLHTGKVSVGVVMNQGKSTTKKREHGLDSKGLYLKEIKQSPGIQALLEKATLVTDMKSASDWSYSAPAYSSPYVRIAGDAACFIDPFFSSGVHLALASGLSAAVTICASIKQQCTEMSAASWHTKKVAEGYTRFLLVVSSALRQIKSQDEPVLSDWDEKTFDRAFSHFRPIIQGQVDVPGKLSQSEVSQTVDFCFKAFAPVPLAEKEAVLEKMREMNISEPATSEEQYAKGVAELEAFMSPEQIRIMHTIRARQMLRSEDTMNIDNFGTDVINGLSPRLVRGELGLVKPNSAPVTRPDILALMNGEEKPKDGINGEATNGEATNGAATNGHFVNGTLPNGKFAVRTFPNGSSATGTSLNGASTTRAFPHGTHSNGTFPDGATTNGTHLNGTSTDGTYKNVSSTNGAYQNGSSTNGAYQNGTSPNGTYLNGTSINGASQHSTTHEDGTETHLAPLNGTEQAQGEASRLQTQDILHNVAEEMETPHDTMLRLFNSTLEISVIKSALDLGIFKRLSASPAPLSVKTLAVPSGADPLLLGRLLRYLASRRFITETSQDHFTANHASRAFSDPRVEGALNYTFTIGGPTYQALPAFLKEHNYANHTSGKFAWHKGANTSLDFFPWAQQHPEALNWFQQLMSVPREGDWLDVVTLPQLSAGHREAPVFVDVGGGFGHQCARLTARFPELRGRVILQDRAETIDIAPPIKGVQAMAHDFFTPQVIKGAKFYYLRTVLHDWEDNESAQILRNLVPALAPDSQILIDEMVLPERGVHWWSASLDLHMYAMLGAMERNETQWRALLDQAGLRLVEVRTYSPVMRHSIIVAEPKV